MSQIWYHATNKNVKGKLKPSNRVYGYGIYLSTKDGIDVYGKNVIEVRIKIENPFYIKGGFLSNIRKEIEDKKISPKEITSSLVDEGYDCIYVQPTKFEKPIVVLFENKNIISQRRIK